MSTSSNEQRGLRTAIVVLALLNVGLWYYMPAICAFVDAVTGRRTIPGNPWIIGGVQELLVYFDPWLALYIFPLVYTLGLAAIPFLLKTDPLSPNAGRPYFIGVLLLLVSFEMVWFILIIVEVLCRGPDWSFYWPGEPWQRKVVPLNFVNLSDYFWVRWLNQSVEDMPWALREFLGLMLVAIYFLGTFFFAGLLQRSTNRTSSYWRCVILLMIVQVATLVPMKMLLRWAFNLKYLIYLPEYGWNV